MSCPKFTCTVCGNELPLPRASRYHKRRDDYFGVCDDEQCMAIAALNGTSPAVYRNQAERLRGERDWRD